MIFQSSFLKIGYFKKFLKNQLCRETRVPAERCVSDRAPCVCDRLGMGCEACRTVSDQRNACSCTRACFHHTEFLKNMWFLRNLGLAEIQNFKNQKHFPSMWPVATLHPRLFISGTVPTVSKPCKLCFGNYRLCLFSFYLHLFFYSLLNYKFFTR